MSTLTMTGTLGQIVNIDIEDYADSLRVMREWGAKGFTSGDVPPGGYSLPHCMADTFDWALIGARPYTNSDNEPGVMHRGNFYKRRDLPATSSKKMTLPACVKFSRGARASDPEHLKEGEDGGFQYVTLIQFRTAGKSVSDFEMPRQDAPPKAQPRPAPVAPAAEPEAEPDLTAQKLAAWAPKIESIKARVAALSPELAKSAEQTCLTYAWATDPVAARACYDDLKAQGEAFKAAPFPGLTDGQRKALQAAAQSAGAITSADRALFWAYLLEAPGPIETNNLTEAEATHLLAWFDGMDASERKQALTEAKRAAAGKIL